MMNRRKILPVLIIILTLLPDLLLSQVLPENGTGVTYTPTVDSLLNVINFTSGDELLNTYPKLHKALYEVGDADIHLKFNDDFAEAAKTAKDKIKEAIAYVLRIEAMYNYRFPDSLLLAESLRALDFMREVKGAEVHYFYTASVVGDIYMLAGNYDEALEMAGRFYNEAKERGNNSGLVASLQTMGKAYGELGVFDKAETSFRESIAAADEVTDKGMKGESYSYLVDMLNDQDRPLDALEAAKEFEAYLVRIGALDGDLKNLCFLNYLGYAATYLKLKQYDLAADYISQVEEFPVGATDLGIYNIESVRFHLLSAQGKYNEAERSLSILENIIGGDASAYQANLRLKEARANLYYDWGMFDHAAVAYKEYIAVKDSLQRVEMVEALNSIRTRFEVDKIEMEQAQERRVFRKTVMWMTLAIVLSFIIIAIVAVNARRLRAKNRSLLESIGEQDKLEKDNEHLRNELARQKSATTDGREEESDKMGEIYLRLKELMKDPRIFTDTEINRKIIAEKLGTNEKYVFDTIRKYYGMSISGYITNLRLNYARNLLAHPSEKRTIETVAQDSGFNSRGSFHRLFKERYGLTPDEFRKLVAGSL